MHVILNPNGSHGDVHPFIAIGRALLARGHRVTLVTSPHFEPLAKGFGFAPVGTEQDFQETIHNPALWHPTRSLKVLFGTDRAERCFRENYEHLVRLADPDTILVGGTLSLAARLMHETHGTPYATVHLQPLSFASVTDIPTYPQFGPKPWWPRWLAWIVYTIGDRGVIDPLLKPPMNRLRGELGLPPLKRIWGCWRHSPQLVLGLYPAWYGPATDLPPQFHRVGFVRYDQAEQPLNEELERFLNAGEPPVVVSFGSAMRTGKPYFQAAVDACRLLKKRCLILAQGTEQIPLLDANMLHVPYAAFSRVFPRCAVAVHHGGIGTSVQALVAGVPQLVMPLGFDQFDNAARLEKLGVAVSLPAKRFRATRAAAKLREALALTVTPRTLEDPMPEILQRLEGLVSSHALTVTP